MIRGGLYPYREFQRCPLQLLKTLTDLAASKLLLGYLLKEAPTVKLPEETSRRGLRDADVLKDWPARYSSLLDAFTRQFDRGRVADLLESPERAEVVGHGRSSTCYRMKMRGAPMDLAVKALDVSPDDPHGRVTLLQWEAALNRALAQPLIPLIPPARLIKGERAWGLVMPFGEVRCQGPMADIPDLADLLSTMTGSLAGRGLCLGDVPQIFTWQNIPFVVDLFDLGKGK